jgi:hypothetical protein
MIHDRLLGYLSEKGRGSWSELRDAWDWLAPDHDRATSTSVVVHELSSLGHIEVSWNPDGIEWCAAPPVITMIPRSGGRALLTGGRTRFLYEPATSLRGKGRQHAGALVDAVNDLNLWLDPFRQARGPTTLMVACESDRDAQELAYRLGIRFNYSVARQLAAILPPLPQYAKLWTHGELPRGFDFERFDVNRLRWLPADDSAPDGLYRAQTFSEHAHALHTPLGWLRVTRDHAVYEVLRWEERAVLRYNVGTLELSVPFFAPLPGLHARAAVLSSGMLPETRERRAVSGRTILSRVYQNVDKEVAEQIASSLSQKLGISDE